MRQVARSALWFVLVPVPVSYGVPTALGNWLPDSASASGGWRAFGAVVAAIGTTALLTCFVDFIRQGFGTPAPNEPPRKLVVARLYRYSRNPMYLSVLLTIIGEGIFWASWIIVGYAAVLGFALHGWIVAIEEPQLRKRFGDQYESYRSRVPRWLGLPRRMELHCKGMHLSGFARR